MNAPQLAGNRAARRAQTHRHVDASSQAPAEDQGEKSRLYAALEQVGFRAAAEDGRTYMATPGQVDLFTTDHGKGDHWGIYIHLANGRRVLVLIDGDEILVCRQEGKGHEQLKRMTRGATRANRRARCISTRKHGRTSRLKPGLELRG